MVLMAYDALEIIYQIWGNCMYMVMSLVHRFYLKVFKCVHNH